MSLDIARRHPSIDGRFYSDKNRCCSTSVIMSATTKTELKYFNFFWQKHGDRQSYFVVGASYAHNLWPLVAPGSAFCAEIIYSKIASAKLKHAGGQPRWLSQKLTSAYINTRILQRWSVVIAGQKGMAMVSANFLLQRQRCWTIDAQQCSLSAPLGYWSTIDLHLHVVSWLFFSIPRDGQRTLVCIEAFQLAPDKGVEPVYYMAKYNLFNKILL